MPSPGSLAAITAAIQGSRAVPGSRLWDITGLEWEWHMSITHSLLSAMSSRAGAVVQDSRDTAAP